MITEKTGNLLEDDAEALVNPVNCVGVMGSGLAKQFKIRFPQMFQEYRWACRQEAYRLGKPKEWLTGAAPKWIINFPTKDDYRENSALPSIIDGLDALTELIARLEITSIAIPALGCGLGGLDWTVVKPEIKRAFVNYPDLDVRLYPPQ